MKFREINLTPNKMFQNETIKWFTMKHNEESNKINISYTIENL